MPKISVIMPAYNAEKYIKEAIDSILGQTFGDFEFIIINDCSKDATENIIQSYDDKRIIYIKNDENLRVARTLNKGLEIAQGEYIARMDADDISMPDRFQKQVEYMDSHLEIAVLGTNLEMLSEDGVMPAKWFSINPAQMKVDLFFSCGLAHPSVMMRRNVIRELGGYDPGYEGLEDYQLWCRVAEKHGVTTLPDMLLRYRIHSGQVTKNPSPEYTQRMRRLKEWQLHRLGLSTQEKGIAGYFRICEGFRPVTRKEILDIAVFFETVLIANRKTGMYDATLLKNTFRDVLVPAVAALSAVERAVICRETELLSNERLLWHLIKQKVKQLLGR